MTLEPALTPGPDTLPKHSTKKRQGALLLNLGTPDAPTTVAVRAYLKEFLMDPYVLDIAFPLRWLLVNGAILPKRPAQSAALYRKVWTDQGSPLLTHLQDLKAKVQNQFHKLNEGGWLIESAMRYGKPSIETALRSFKAAGIDDVIVIPLYPQYSLAATESSVAKCTELFQKIIPGGTLSFVPPFYSQSIFIDSFVEVFKKSLINFSYDHLLFSFHGLPERQVKKTTNNFCFSQDSCCSEITEANQNCYRAQCYATAKLLAKGLGIPGDKYSVCFQSRLGRTPWIRPYTDELYRELPKKGVRRLAVACPAFVADCLETLEEVQIRGREEFIQSGGEELKLIPSLNSSGSWVQAVADMLQACSKAQ
ncbi:MAG: ferrochelatase [Bdellovibrionia bacterium]